jgi:insulin receptor
VADEEKVCGSIVVRNTGDRLSQLHNCTVIRGHVQIVLLDATKPSDFDIISFPQLREITQYLVVYRVAGLTSLGKLFPNLMLIRGLHSPQSTFPGLSLMIHDNGDLREIGLYSLTNITRGSIIISRNARESFSCRSFFFPIVLFLRRLPRNPVACIEMVFAMG